MDEQLPTPEPANEARDRAQRDVLRLSVVIPVFNEAGNLRELCERLRRVLEAQPGSYEIVLIDDGSTDDSLAVLRQLQVEDERVRAIRLRRRFGQSAALSAGFDHARGGVVVSMDGDLQNDPEDIPALVGKLTEGYDLVCGWRVERKDPFLTRRLPARLANLLISRSTGVHLHDYGCTLKAYRPEVIRELRLHGGMHRFIPALAGGMGFRIAEVPVRHASRRWGRSKYGLGRISRVVMDLLAVKFVMDWGSRPMRLFGPPGVAGLIAGAALLGYAAWAGRSRVDSAWLWIPVLLLFSGLHLLALGLLGELIAHAGHYVSDRVSYRVREILEAVSVDQSNCDEQLHELQLGTLPNHGQGEWVEREGALRREQESRRPSR